MRELTREEKQAWVIKRQGSEMILYKGLLHLAHEEGLAEMKTRLVVLPDAQNSYTVVAHASATFADEQGNTRTFEGLGDANAGWFDEKQLNVGNTIRVHYIRMAETRAKARALRDALDVGYVAVEELGDDDPAPAREPQVTHVDTQPQRRAETPPVQRSAPQQGNAPRAPQREADEAPRARPQAGPGQASDKQIGAILSLGRKLQVDRSYLERKAQQIYGAATLDDLTKQDASNFIDLLQAAKDDASVLEGPNGPADLSDDDLESMPF